MLYDYISYKYLNIKRYIPIKFFEYFLPHYTRHYNY